MTDHTVTIYPLRVNVVGEGDRGMHRSRHESSMLVLPFFNDVEFDEL